jgi:hypothetical protein
MHVPLRRSVFPTDLGRPANPYTLVAVAPTAREIVSTAGGLICDRALSGWRVHILVDDYTGQKALTILGAQRHSFAVESTSDTTRHVAVSALIIASGPRIGELVDREDLWSVYDFQRAEVLTCGFGAARRTSTGKILEYQMSPAARAFKTQAWLSATQTPVHRDDEQPDVEHFSRSSATAAQAVLSGARLREA